ncbi:MAG TPA: replicative DNA helicase [Prolixibacteraceae bacterium]|nr:replicative DNA helicase [Prolixibacteraceae bacterium]
MVANKKQNNQQQSIEQINAQYGKLPPQAIEVEEAVIGALMLERDAFQMVSGIIDTTSFYKDEHQKIFEAVKSIVEKEKPVDLMTVTIELKNRNQLEEVGGPMEITRLTRRVASGAHIEFHARIVAQKFIQRELIRVSTEIQTMSYDDMVDVEDLLSEARSKLNGIENTFTSANPGKNMDIVAKEALIDLEADVKLNKEGSTPGISTGLRELDESTGGWRNTNLITIAARPGVGKTSFALFQAVTAARQGNWVNFYGLEMKSTDLFRILLSGETDIARSDIRDGKIEDYHWEKINIAVGELEKLPILWNDDPDLNVNQIVANTRRNKKAGRCDLVIIDYLQLVNPADKKAIREQQIAEITRKFKQMALRENIPVIELSQLNRDIDKRTDKEPTLSDLRESGAIEQDSDVVIFLYDKDGIKLKISKNRRGKKGHPDFWANEEKTIFADSEPLSADYFKNLPVNERFEKDGPF